MRSHRCKDLILFQCSNIHLKHITSSISLSSKPPPQQQQQSIRSEWQRLSQQTPPLTTSSSSGGSAFAYCVEALKTRDYDNYIWAMQLPKHLRPSIFTLRAFDLELTAIPAQAKQTMILRMRFQWWRDAINSAYKGRPANQPVISALASVLKQHTLTRYRMQQIITTREDSFADPSPPATLAALEDIAEGTSSQLILLQLEAALLSANSVIDSSNCNNGNGNGRSISPTSSLHGKVIEAGSALGRAIGLTTSLQSCLDQAQKGRVTLPVDILTKHGASVDDIVAGRMTHQVKDAVADVAATARMRLAEARGLKTHVPAGAARAVMLGSVACEGYLKGLEKVDYDPFHVLLQGASVGSPLMHQLKVKWNLMTGSY
jgi:NADH dehydrogenase [ubiquinone] 1 alpha subcomplex assembly factor 6